MAASLIVGMSRKIDTWVGLLICWLLYLYSRLREPRLPAMRATTPPGSVRVPECPRRILTIKTYGLGNVALLMPVLAALRRAYPDAEIDFLTLRENRDLAQRSGLIDRVLPLRIDGYRQLAGSLSKIFRSLRQRRYDLVIDFEQFIKLSTIIAFASGARDRIGFNTDGQRRGWLYTTRVVYTDSEHMSRIFARLLRPLEIDTSPGPFELATRPEEESRLGELLAAAGVEPGHFPLIAVHVGSGPNFYDVPLKRWPLERFARLGDELISRYGAALVFTGKGEEERALVEETLSLMTHPAVNGCDEFSIGELLCLLRRCNLVVSNDTSVVHLAAALRTPVVCFFGPTNPEQYGPGKPEDLVLYKDFYCSPCSTNYNLKVSYCADPTCIRSISVEETLDAIQRNYLDSDAPWRAFVEGEGDRPATE
jgi:ADP-heptose:LPS heptosyltransferase